MREKYESLALATLKELAKSRGIKGVSTMKKEEVVEAMLSLDEKEKSEKAEEKKPVATAAPGEGTRAVQPQADGMPPAAATAYWDRDGHNHS